MKRYWYYLTLACTFMLAGGVITSCSDDNTDSPEVKDPEFSAQLLSTDLDAASIRLTTVAIAEYAYVIEDAEAAVPTADEIFAAAEGSRSTVTTGKGSIAEDGTTDVKCEGLQPETEYTAYFAAKDTAGAYYKSVVSIDFTTVDSPAEFAVELSEVGTSTADIKLTTVKITNYAYLAYEKDQAPTTVPSATVMFATGTTGECVDGENTVTVNRLSPATEYVVYFAAQTTAEEYYDEVASVEFTTSSFTDAVTVFDIEYSSFRAQYNVPESVKADGHVLKWATMSLFDYNSNISYGYREDQMLNLNDVYYHNFFDESTTMTFDYENSMVHNADGSLYEDEDGYTYLYDVPVPGQPQILLTGEFEIGEHEWGWGEGYYSPLFDIEAYEEDFYGGWDIWAAGTRTTDYSKYWTGFYDKQEFVTAKPEPLNANLNVTMSLKSNGGTISFNPDPEIWMYCVMVLEDYTMDYLLPLLDNNEDYLQWFTTSIEAVYNVGMLSLSGPANLDLLGDLFYEMDRNETYTLYVVGLGNEYGTTQCFETHSFKLPDPTKPAPEIEVTGIDKPASEGEATPYEVWFNVKCTSKDAESVAYACNYEREWETSRKSYSDEQLIAMGGTFDSDEVALINSDEGYNVKFDTREDSVTYLGVIAENDEGTACDPVIGKNRSLREPDAERVESDLFTSLNGDWTATATVTYNTYENNVLVTKEEVKTCKVTIGDPTYPATLSSDVYDLYPKMTTEEVDALYEEFKEQVEIFNSKTRGQNRILCGGYDFSTSVYYDMSYASPYDLFVSTTYSGYDNASLLSDFGPKWYLQVAEDGSVSVPFNTNYFAPMAATTRYTYYLIGASTSHSLPYTAEGTGYFPVKVSDDKNTITVDPLVYNDETYYPVAGNQYYSGYFTIPGKVISSVVLTRGWSGEATTSSISGTAQAAKLENLNGMKVTPVKKAKGRTIMPKSSVKREHKEYRVVSAEEFKTNVTNYANRLKQTR